MEPRSRERAHSRRPAADIPLPPRDAVTALARSIVEFSEDAIIGKDLTGTILSWNRGAEAVYGFSAEEAIGQSINLLVPTDRLDEEQQILGRIRSGHRIHHFDTVRVRKGGSRIDVSLTISPVWEAGKIVGASHIARDISERKRLEAANGRLAAIVESSEDAIISKDLTGVVETWNSGAERVYGYTSAEAIGQNLSFLLPDERKGEERQILERVARGERVQHFETTRLRKDGNLIHVSVTISPICDTTGKIVGASHVARDITERRAFEEQMRQTQRLESVGLLAGGIAHDFNNLLTGIIGNASLIGEELPPQSRSSEFLDSLMAAARRAADLTAQLLAYSGRGRFVVGPVNVTDLISEINLLVRASVSKNITVRLDLAGDLPRVQADRNQIHQLLMNLIINGAEAIGEDRPGTVTVRTGTEHLDDSYIQVAFPDSELAAGEYVCVEVRDSGCGMDETTRNRIFDPFFTTKFMGRGLGLSAALGIVQGHHGAIRVHSRPGEGTIFKVYLPATAGPARAEEPRRRGTVLVVDDEEIVRQVARAALESAGYTVLIASDGREGVEMVETVPAIGLVILDITMPVLGGEEALRQMQARRPELPVVLSSGYSEAEARRRFEAYAIAGFLQKPYTSSAIRQKAEKILGGPVAQSVLTR